MLYFFDSRCRKRGKAQRDELMVALRCLQTSNFRGNMGIVRYHCNMGRLGSSLNDIKYRKYVGVYYIQYHKRTPNMNKTY